MYQKIIALAAIATSMSSGAIVHAVERPATIDAHETTIVAVWTCGAPQTLANDATQTVRTCEWVVK